MSDFTIPKKTQIVIDEGTYPATIESLEETEGEYGPQVRFTFDLEYFKDEIKLTGWSSQNYSEKSKLFKWCKAAIGKEFDPNADFESSWMVGKKVLLNVSRKYSTNGGEFNKVEDVMPPPRKLAQQTPASENDTPPQPDLWEEEEQEE